MNPIRLVISDVDGTLVDHDKKLQPATVDAVQRLEAAGVPFALISARPRSGVEPLAATLGTRGPIAAFNGGTLFKAGGETIRRHVIDPAVVSGMFALVADAPVSTWVFADDRWHADTLDNPHVPHERLASNQEPMVHDDMRALADRADKITFVSDDPALLASLTEQGRASFGTRATIGQSQTYYLDVTDLSANKGDGVTALAAAYGVPLDAVAVIGDMWNDVPMFERAGYSIAMGQAPDGVKAKADAVTGGNDQAGVAQAIDRLILPRVAAKA